MNVGLLLGTFFLFDIFLEMMNIGTKKRDAIMNIKKFGNN
jgi:hypothetical protein